MSISLLIREITNILLCRIIKKKEIEGEVNRGIDKEIERDLWGDQVLVLSDKHNKQEQVDLITSKQVDNVRLVEATQEESGTLDNLFVSCSNNRKEKD